MRCPSHPSARENKLQHSALNPYFIFTYIKKKTLQVSDKTTKKKKQKPITELLEMYTQSNKNIYINQSFCSDTTCSGWGRLPSGQGCTGTALGQPGDKDCGQQSSEDVTERQQGLIPLGGGRGGLAQKLKAGPCPCPLPTVGPEEAQRGD